jgi:hypothetical protein
VILSISLILQLIGRTGYLFVMVAATLTMPIECRCGGPVVAPHSLVSIVDAPPLDEPATAVETAVESVVSVPRISEIPDTMAIGFTIIAVVSLGLILIAPRAGPPVTRKAPTLIPWRAAPSFPPPRPSLSLI